LFRISKMLNDVKLAEPQDRGLAFFPGDFVNRPAMANPIPELGQMAEFSRQRLAVCEASFKMRPECLAQNRVLKLAEIAMSLIADILA
jgi:hypothetical protein